MWEQASCARPDSRPPQHAKTRLPGTPDRGGRPYVYLLLRQEAASPRSVCSRRVARLSLRGCLGQVIQVADTVGGLDGRSGWLQPDRVAEIEEFGHVELIGVTQGQTAQVETGLDE